nr:MAG TPA: hypothetical protein [Caudoviricetes sp.]
MINISSFYVLRLLYSPWLRFSIVICSRCISWLSWIIHIAKSIRFTLYVYIQLFWKIFYI